MFGLDSNGDGGLVAPAGLGLCGVLALTLALSLLGCEESTMTDRSSAPVDPGGSDDDEVADERGDRDADATEDDDTGSTDSDEEPGPTGRADGGQGEPRADAGASRPTDAAPDAAAPADDDEADTDADEPSDDSPDDEEDEPDGPDASTPAPSSGDFDAPGPHMVVRETNVGMSFSNDVRDDSSTCRLLLPGLVGDNATPEQVEAAVAYPADEDRRLYTVFRPETLEEGKRYPVVTWANGTCGLPSGYRALLSHIASHGFIVIAANYRQIGNGALMLRALDFLRAEDMRAESPLFGKVDLERVGATGHSQGGGSTVSVSSDPRIDVLVPIEGGGSGTNGKPAFFIAGTDDNIVSPATVSRAYRGVQRGPTVYGLAKDVDHISPLNEASKIWGPVVAWFRAHLADDAAARAWFYGDCSLCKNPAWTIERKNLN